MTEYIKVISCKGQAKPEIVELPVDEENVPLSTVTSQFPTATGLQYVDPEEHLVKPLKSSEGLILAPTDGWGQHVYMVTVPDSKPTSAKRNASAMESEKSEPAQRIFIGSLPYSVRDTAQLKKLFPNGIEYSLPVHSDTGRPKGFAYITYDSVEAAEKVMKENEGKPIDGRVPHFDFAPFGLASKEAKSEACARLYIGGIPFSISSKDDLTKFFEGSTEISLPTHSDSGKIKGFGYVTYPSVELAEMAMKEKANLEIDGRKIRLDFAPFGGGKATKNTRGGRGDARGGFRNRDGDGGGGYGYGNNRDFRGYGGGFRGGGGRGGHRGGFRDRW